jgi:AraC-like DNA-binding protein
VALDVNCVKLWISRNLEKAKDIPAVAAAFDVSPETLRKTFQRIEGVSLSAFLRHEKIEAAKRRLEMTDDKCFEIIYDLKLGREDTFARLFKRVTGTTMQEYREAERTRGTKSSNVALGTPSTNLAPDANL